LSSHSGFQLKQFTVAQDQCAMKVSLDACLFGALCNVNDAQRILDIGTGTGLLSLMVAQRCQAKIDAVELDNNAAKQALANVALSPFHDRIEIHNKSIQQFVLQNSQPIYDTIICNPPFFSQHLLSNDTQRNLARHNHSLSFKELCESIHALMHKHGEAWLLLPQHEHNHFQTSANEYGLHLSKRFNVFSREHKPSKLGIWVYQKKQQAMIEKSLTIYQPNSQQYSDEFSRLMADYYLKL
jgi:tRNA1Val (adenine37-N6)-methyltransferase